MQGAGWLSPVLGWEMLGSEGDPRFCGVLALACVPPRASSRAGRLPAERGLLVRESAGANVPGIDRIDWASANDFDFRSLDKVRPAPVLVPCVFCWREANRRSIVFNNASMSLKFSVLFDDDIKSDDKYLAPESSTSLLEIYQWRRN